MARFPRFKTVNLIHKAFEKAITGASTRVAKRARSEPAHNVYAQGVREGADTYISCSIFGTKTLEHIGHTKGMRKGSILASRTQIFRTKISKEKITNTTAVTSNTRKESSRLRTQILFTNGYPAN